MGCSGLSSITLPYSVTSIGIMVFFECKKLCSVTVANTTPPNVNHSFVEVNENITIYVPAESVEKYKAAKGWSKSKNIMALPAK